LFSKRPGVEKKRILSGREENYNLLLAVKKHVYIVKPIAQGSSDQPQTLTVAVAHSRGKSAIGGPAVLETVEGRGGGERLKCFHNKTV